MADKPPCFLYKETRVNLDWADASSAIVDIDVPSVGFVSQALSAPLRSRRAQTSQQASEEVFKHRNYATAASMHLRPADRFPRCILWRVTEDWRVLTVRSADFTKHESHRESTTTFRFTFPDAIRPGSVGFADSPDGKPDELCVYVLTAGKVVYCLTLTPDLWHKKPAKKEGKANEYCRMYSPGAFMLRSPHYLQVIDYGQLLVSMQDGSLLKLERNRSTPDDPDSLYLNFVEKAFSDTTYMSLFKEKLPWFGSATVPYRGGGVNHSTVISAVAYHTKPPMDTQDEDMAMTSPNDIQESLLFTVSVDHMLKVWSLQKQTLLLQTDLLDEPAPAHSKVKTLLDPSPSHLLSIIEASFQGDHLFYLVSFSSATTNKFKFRAAKLNDDGKVQDLVDLYPNHEFEAKPPTTNAPWVISEFRITPASSEKAQLFNLWVLWKSDTNFRVQTLQFDIKVIPETWTEWATATTDTLHKFPERVPARYSSEGHTDWWCDWVFYPGRHIEPVIETALDIFEQNFARIDLAPYRKESLQSRVSRALSSAVELEKGTDNSGPNYGTYNYNLELQWGNFGRLCAELDKGRAEALSLVADPVTGFVWTVNVDGVTALRECLESEIISHNFLTHVPHLEFLEQHTSPRLGAALTGNDLSDVMLLVATAESLRTTLEDRVVDYCEAVFSEEAVKEPMFSVEDTMMELYSECFGQSNLEDVYDKLGDALDGLHDPRNAFGSILSSLYQQEAHTGSTRLTAFGGKVLLAGSQEVINVNHRLIFDLLLLIIFINALVDESPAFARIEDLDNLYVQLINYYKEYEALRWVSSHSPGQASLPQISSEEEMTQSVASLTVNGSKPVTSKRKKEAVLDLLVPESFGPSPLGPGRSGSVAVSLCIRQFLGSLDLSPFENGRPTVAGILLHANATGLAEDFEKFLPVTAWGMYMKGRTNLVNHNANLAASYFKKAAYGMSIAKPDAFSGVNNLFPESLDLASAVGGGLARYYLHVARIFSLATPLNTLTFTRSALSALAGSDNDPQLLSEILLTAFNAALAAHDFTSAYLALVKYTSAPLQRAALRSLAIAMVTAGAGEELCSLPFAGLQDDVDAALLAKCDSILDLPASPPFHKTLYAWRIARGNYRGAAEVVYQKLHKLRTAALTGAASQEEIDEGISLGSRKVMDCFLVLINTLACCGEGQDYVLVDVKEEVSGRGGKRLKVNGAEAGKRREVRTLRDVRGEYQAEVERMAMLINGGFFV